MIYLQRLKWVEAMTFVDLVEYGKQSEPKSIVNGMPWHFVWKGRHISHENDSEYTVMLGGGEDLKMTPNDVLWEDDDGDLHCSPVEDFFRKWDSAPARRGTAKDEVDAWLQFNVKLVTDELKRAIAKFPTWPEDPLHAVAVVNEEVGELNKAVLQETYESSKNGQNDVRDEAIQAAAMALRFIMHLGDYKFRGCPQVKENSDEL